ncbi:hypothetical protein HF325_002545 [Metschnikowia pulcherrima]|uniref:Uncharacterized protein n=1 Tax=Metschnikowia pulcherrima TaxID=27326 RepID=A0A8H7LD73_9ASCO|nr:hypothetical protein HF325_002545 [Metschnikowia pulcherrima]
MPAYLNVETIKNAAELVNATLKTKGHIQEDLCFVTVDWESLIADQPEKDALERLTVQEKIYNNDKNTVNAFYSLLQDLDRHNRQHEAANHVMAAKDAQIAKLERRLASAELEAAGKERKTRPFEHLEKKNRAQAREVTRLKNVNLELQNKYEVEKRRMAHEISELKSLILHSRGLSTTVSYGRPLNMGKLPNRPRSKEPEVNPQIVHYNNPSVNNVEPQILTPGASESSEINEALGERRKRDKLHLLQDENKLLSSSLQEALKALEEWRKLRKTTD